MIRKSIVFFAAAILISLWAAVSINSFLGIDISPKSLPETVLRLSGRDASFIPETGLIEGIVIPSGTLQDDLYRRAAFQMASLIAERNGYKPIVTDRLYQIPAGRVIMIGDHPEPPQIQRDPGDKSNPEGFEIRSFGHGGRQFMSILGNSRIGDVYGAYRLCDEILSPTDTPFDIFDLAVKSSPFLPMRFAGPGALGVTPDPEHWGNDYSHHHGEFHEVILSGEPFIDRAGFDKVFNEFKEYVHRMISYGYNGVVMNGFLEYVNFDRVGSGFDIYDPHSSYRKSHETIQEAFRRLFRYADRMGLKIILRTDMVVLSEPLETYFEKRFGGLNVENCEFWEVYGLGLEELFSEFPEIDGLIIRIGEAGAVYNSPNSPKYYSALQVRTPLAVKIMLNRFLSAAKRYGKQIIFRNWSVGIGDIGAMHTNPDVYENVLDGVGSKNLIISTKYGKGDFTAWLPLNPTLRAGRQKRLIEFQARREYEGFNAFPNYTGPCYQIAMKNLIAANPNIRGVWVWTQRGGPLRAGPMLLYPFHGFWKWIDINVFAAGRLAWNPDSDIHKLTGLWIRRHFTDNSKAASKLKQVMLLSRDAVLKGIYIGEFGKRQIRVLGMETPPVFLVWDIVSGSGTVLSMIYCSCRDKFDDAVAEGFEAVECVKRMKRIVRRIPKEAFIKTALQEQWIESLNYEENLFETLAIYRKAFLNYYRWLDTGESGAFQIWKAAYGRFELKLADHQKKYENDLNFPAYNFFAVEKGFAIARKTQEMIWAARLLIILIFTGFLAARMKKSRSLSFFTALAFVFVSAATLTSFQSFIVPLIFISETLVCFLLMRLLKANRSASRISMYNAAAVPSCLLLFVFTAVAAIRGPLYVGFLFWTSPAFRIGAISLCMFSVFLFLFLFLKICLTEYQFRYRQAAGNMLTLLGGMAVVSGAAIQIIGLESLLTALNNETAILPLSLSKVHGIATTLNINPDSPFFAVIIGLCCFISGIGLLTPRQSTQVKNTKNLESRAWF